MEKFFAYFFLAGIFVLASCENQQRRGTDADERLISRDTIGVEREVEIEETIVEYDTTSNTETYETDVQGRNRTTDVNRPPRTESGAVTDRETGGTGTGTGTATGIGTNVDPASEREGIRGTDTRERLLNNTIDKLSRLPEEKLKEISNYTDFLLYRSEGSQGVGTGTGTQGTETGTRGTGTQGTGTQGTGVGTGTGTQGTETGTRGTGTQGTGTQGTGVGTGTGTQGTETGTRGTGTQGTGTQGTGTGTQGTGTGTNP